jgi:hypothetical protein
MRTSRRVEHSPAAYDDPALIGVIEPGDAAEQGRLPAATGPQQDQDLAGLDLETDVVHGSYLVTAPANEALADPGDPQYWLTRAEPGDGPVPHVIRNVRR